jgi:spore coat protein U-like protein
MCSRSRLRRTLILSAALFAISVAPAPAQGVHLKTVVHQGGSVARPCRASVTAPLKFVYDPFSDIGQFATAVVTLTCNPAQFLTTIAISPGNANQFLRYREMWRNGTDSSRVLEYNFYTTSNYNIVWGDGTSGSSVETINQTVTTYNAVIFAKLQYRQSSVTAGEYSDTVTVTFNLS